jgi:hypothetical protein
MTNEHDRQASALRWRYQRHCERIEQSGRSSDTWSEETTPSTCSTTPHRFSDHCRHADLTHVSAKRKRFSGERPCCALSINPRLTTSRSGKNVTCPSAFTMPTRMAPSLSRALGHKTVGASLRATDYPSFTVSVFPNSPRPEGSSLISRSQNPGHRMGKYANRFEE